MFCFLHIIYRTAGDVVLCVTWCEGSAVANRLQVPWCRCSVCDSEWTMLFPIYHLQDCWRRCSVCDRASEPCSVSCLSSTGLLATLFFNRKWTLCSCLYIIYRIAGDVVLCVTASEPCCFLFIIYRIAGGVILCETELVNHVLFPVYHLQDCWECCSLTRSERCTVAYISSTDCWRRCSVCNMMWRVCCCQSSAGPLVSMFCV